MLTFGRALSSPLNPDKRGTGKLLAGHDADRVSALPTSVPVARGAAPEPPLVLIADDDEDIVALVSFRLERSGYRVLAVRDGAEAVRLATEARPALAVLDVTMPVLTGLEATRLLRAAPETSALPIILLTARASAADVAAGTAAGATTYVTKPFSPQDLARSVDAILRNG